MAKFLEVIVTSTEEAMEAEAGGAYRLELVRSLDAGGLTPTAATVEAVLKAVRIPVRMMLRQTADMVLHDQRDLRLLQEAAAEALQWRVEGFVVGFLRGDAVDREAMRQLLGATGGRRITFHRAFDEVAEPAAAIEELKELGQVDRILTVGGSGEWAARKGRLLAWQEIASPEIKLLAGAGLERAILEDLAAMPQIEEVHVGRAARVPREVTGAVRRGAVSTLASCLR